MNPEPGAQLGIYRLTHRLGAGGMGEVWKAEDTRLHRNVAIKLLPPAMTDDAESRARLLREARTAGQLYHPNIATIHGIELDGETPYIVMEYVEGESLTHAIGARRLTELQIAEMGRGIADALAEAHAKGIIHRDIKPDNVVLSGNRVKVLDFGIAKRYGDAAQAPPGEIVTEAGVVLGTVNYMSPEQATGRQLDGRSDIFSLGVMLFQALTGQLPFRGNSNLETLKQILRSEPPELGAIAPAVSPEMAAIVRRCLKKAVEERYQSAEELAHDLARIVALGFSRTPPRPVPIPAQPAADSDAITMVQAGAIGTLPDPATGKTRPTLPGLTKPDATVPGTTRPDVAIPSPAPPVAQAQQPVPPAMGPQPIPVSPSPGTDQQILHAAAPGSYTQWIVAGASFVVVLAIAGGFVVAKMLESNHEPAGVVAAQAGSSTSSRPATPAAMPAPPPATPPATQPAPAAGAEAKPRATQPRTQPSPDLRAAAASVTSAQSAAPSTAESNADYRAAIESLEGAGWRYLDDQGRMTPGAEAAEPLFAQALDAEPDNVSAQLHLAVIRLFRRRYDVAQKAIHPLLTSDRLSHTERAIASYTFSASAIAPSGNGIKEFETSLDEALAYYGKEPQFAAFARDARWLVNRGRRR